MSFNKNIAVIKPLYRKRNMNLETIFNDDLRIKALANLFSFGKDKASFSAILNKFDSLATKLNYTSQLRSKFTSLSLSQFYLSEPTSPIIKFATAVSAKYEAVSKSLDSIKGRDILNEINVRLPAKLTLDESIFRRCNSKDPRNVDFATQVFSITGYNFQRASFEIVMATLLAQKGKTDKKFLSMVNHLLEFYLKQTDDVMLTFSVYHLFHLLRIFYTSIEYFKHNPDYQYMDTGYMKDNLIYFAWNKENCFWVNAKFNGDIRISNDERHIGSVLSYIPRTTYVFPEGANPDEYVFVNGQYTEAAKLEMSYLADVKDCINNAKDTRTYELSSNLMGLEFCDKNLVDAKHIESFCLDYKCVLNCPEDLAIFIENHTMAGMSKYDLSSDSMFAELKNKKLVIGYVDTADNCFKYATTSMTVGELLKELLKEAALQ